MTRASNSGETPFEVLSDVGQKSDENFPPAKVVVLGGNGFVGSAICKEATQQGLSVVSINRSGAPAISDEWVDNVEWVAADVFNSESWAYTLPGAAVVISCIGGFGTVGDMERICGDATIAAVEAAVEAGVPRFVFVSVHEYNIPEKVKEASGYFSGKKRAETAVLSSFPTSGTVLRPGFIYGERLVPKLGVKIPLSVVGEPLQKFLENDTVKTLSNALSGLPASDLVFAPPVSVEAVAAAALKCLSDPGMVGIIDIKAIQTKV
eukprot:CAMPEP_0196579260 /NCGR_PEP_ID=MMETSP1081-20130531/19813_1 /TAXON_ID=36882 /ORGANISM="Pyramimonas amylifera, Strain CCMP720" /LENGTH=263 /DNA_ID=CAMNT_0041898777 /DNA_START=266 /DNA_END=1057 /DNA_ORIENTATION=-